MSEIFNFAVVIPIANESKECRPFVDVMRNTLDSLRGGIVFLIEVLGIGKDELYQTHFEFIDALDGNEELHEASVPILHFVRNM